jgi:hypothetical protein
MAELNAPIIAKASATAGEVPLASDLEVAEIAVNTADGKLFTKHTDDSIKEISGSGGGGAVDSVNGETGVVSLGIQDMDDFSATATSVEVDLGNWSSNVSGDYPDQGGEWRNYDAATNDVWQIYKEDIFGDDYSTELLALVTGDVIQVSTDSGSTYSISVTLTADAVYSAGGGGNTVIDIVLSDTDGAKLSGLTALNLRITQPGPDAPLVEGDILQWDNAEQKFKPAQAKERIQDMDDFELNLDPSGFSPSSSTGRWATFLTSHSQSGGIYTFPTSGQWRMYKTADTSEGVLQAGDPDSDSQDMAYWDSLDDTPGLMIRFEVDGVTYGPVNVTDAFFASSTGVAVMKWDSSEFDPSTTSWGYVADADGPPVTTEAREASVVIGYADPTVVFPLADGDILQWDNSDQKFKPTQLPGAAPVDSVNGETGTVSLGVQEMDDFEFNQVPPSGYTYDQTFHNAIEPGYARYATNFTPPLPFTIHEEDSNGNDFRSELLLLSPGDQFWWSFDNGSNFEQFTLDTITEGVVGRWDLTPTSPPSGSWSSVNNTPELRGADWKLYLVDPTSPTDVSLVEGDILQWNNSDQKFKPAQLPSAAPVDSVNGETGVVSLGIQDMDDVETSPTTYVYDHSNNTPNPGEWTDVGNSTAVSLHFSREDANGLVLPVLSTSDVINVSTNGGTTWCTGSPSAVQGSGSELTFSAELLPCFAESQLWIQLASDNGLSEGDILQWNDADQKLKPTSDYVSLTTLKTEVAASTDFADFQSRIAAL